MCLGRYFRALFHILHFRGRFTTLGTLASGCKSKIAPMGVFSCEWQDFKTVFNQQTETKPTHFSTDQNRFYPER